LSFGECLFGLLRELEGTTNGRFEDGSKRASQFGHIFRSRHRGYSKHQTREQRRFKQRRACRNDDDRCNGFVYSAILLVMGLINRGTCMRIPSTIVDRVHLKIPLFRH